MSGKSEVKETKEMYSLRDLTGVAFQIIVKAGTAKSDAMEAIYASKDGKYELAEKKLEEAHKNLIEAEKEHFELIQKEAQGVEIKVPLILMHAEDQLLSTNTILVLAEEFINIYKELRKKTKSQ